MPFGGWIILPPPLGGRIEEDLSASDEPQDFAIDVGVALELPAGEPEKWKLVSPFEDQRIQEIDLQSGAPRTLSLEPFEVLVFDGGHQTG